MTALFQIPRCCVCSRRTRLWEKVTSRGWLVAERRVFPNLRLRRTVACQTSCIPTRPTHQPSNGCVSCTAAKPTAPLESLANAAKLARKVLAAEPSGANAPLDTPDTPTRSLATKFSGGDASLWGPSHHSVLAKRRRRGPFRDGLEAPVCPHTKA